jgi:pyruvate dehydrogenase E2 component (dihydrolipoamide acetyltransferase)
MSTIIDIKIPEMGDFDDVPVIEILVSEGETVAVDDSLITLESEKATMEIPSPHAGKITEILVAIDENVRQGTVIARMAVDSTSTQQKDSSFPRRRASATKTEA